MKKCLSFRKAFEIILEIEKIRKDEKTSFNGALFNFLESELLSFSLELKDRKFFLEISKILKSSDLEENFDKLISLFKEREKLYLKKQIFLVFGRNEEHFKIVKKYITQSKFECEYLELSNTKGGTPIIFPTLIEKISSSFKVVVILSADDKGKLNQSKERFTLRPRLNVILETGLSYGILSKDDVLLLWDNKISNRELISDLGGCFTINIGEDQKWKKQLTKKLEEFNKEWENLFLY